MASSAASREQDGCNGCVKQLNSSESGTSLGGENVSNSCKNCGCEKDYNCGPISKSKCECTGCICEKMKQMNISTYSTPHSDNAKKNILEVSLIIIHLDSCISMRF